MNIPYKSAVVRMRVSHVPTFFSHRFLDNLETFKYRVWNKFIELRADVGPFYIPFFIVKIRSFLRLESYQVLDIQAILTVEVTYTWYRPGM